MNRKHTTSITVLVSLLFSSCSKKETSQTPTNNGVQQQSLLSDDEKFLVGSWVFDSAMDSFRSKADPDKVIVTQGSVPCRMDDVYHLGADKKYTKEEGQDTCVRKQSYAPQDWGLQYGAMIFSDGPNPPMFSNKFRKIDNDHFAIAWGNQEWEGYRIIVFYYRRK